LLDLAVFLAGLWVIITGKIPSGLLAGRDHKIDKTSARYLGILFLVPAPLNMFIGVVLVLFGLFEKYRLWLYALDIVIVIGMLVLINSLVRGIGQDIASNNAIVEKKKEIS